MQNVSTRTLHRWSLNQFDGEPAPSLFQKILLTTDGTVTELLALYTGQAISARKVSQSLVKGEAAPAALCCGPDEPVLHRTIVLGPLVGSELIFAESFFVFGFFSPAIQRSLMETDLPIGLLWRQDRVEMFREVIERGVEQSAPVASLLKVPDDTPLFSRTYALSHDRKPFGLITEKFAHTAYR